ncbi:hypothetical protein J7E73_06735 [Paenibacillus albidus]|uniref:hypothetical protein n=1 Tax=Paenibacillus albidus TaxID=2041023 RepID=UPI001BE66A8D|nr:hypothetical protein [Paenibacillus albidus]MBT2288839.1 hypothetical protein [Paenibacillus albidus]
MNRKRIWHSFVAGLVILALVSISTPAKTNAAATTSYQISPGDSALITSTYTTTTSIM